VAKPIDIEAFEVGQRFRHFNTIWVQKGLLAAIWVLGVMFLQHPTQTVRFIARRLMYWGKR
jgi:hypothetical protein